MITKYEIEEKDLIQKEKQQTYVLNQNNYKTINIAAPTLEWHSYQSPYIINNFHFTSL